MRLRGLLILVMVGLAMIPLFFLNRLLGVWVRPRLSPGRFFLYVFANFLLIIVYTVLVVGIIVRVFPH